MENELENLSAYKTCEYLLILQPHEELWNKIIQMKKEFAEKFNAPMAEWTKPHITIVKFAQLEMMEQRIVNRLKMISMSLPSFKVEMKDFGSFPSHTIYINILSKIPIVNTVKAVRQAQKLMKLDKDNKPHFITEPHLSLCRKLQPWQYEKAWLEYEHKNFSGRFVAEKMRLLRKHAGERQGYLTVDEFNFQNVPVAAKQGELF